MKAKNIVIKAIVGIVLIALLACVIYFLSRPDEEIADEEIPVYTSNEADITRIEIDGDEQFALVKTGGEWAMEGMEGVALVANMAQTLSDSLSNITAKMLVEQHAEDLSIYGLDNPSVIVTLDYANSQESFLIGNESGDCYYFKLASSNDVYIVSYDLLYLTKAGKMSFLSNTVFKASSQDITKIEMGNLVVEKIGEDWQENTPYEISADTSRVESDLLAYMTEIVAEEILNEGNFPVVETVLNVSVGDTQTEITISEDLEGYRYLTRSGSEYVYKVSSSSLGFLNATGFGIMSKYVAPISITSVTKIEMTSPTGQDVLTIDSPDSEAPIFYKNGKEADETNFRDFYQTLMSLQFSAEGSARGEAEYSIVFTMADASVQKLDFISSSDANYAVSINGTARFILTKKSVRDVFGYVAKIKTV